MDEVNKMKTKKKKPRLTLEVDKILVSMMERARVKELVAKTSNLSLIDEALYGCGRISDSEIFRGPKAKRKSPERNQICSLISLQQMLRILFQVLVLLHCTPIEYFDYEIIAF